MHPGVVILDLQMPVMNGLEAARQINQLAPKTAMLMFTMHNSDELRTAARAAGIREVLSKSEAAGDHLMNSLKNVVTGS